MHLTGVSKTAGVGLNTGRYKTKPSAPTNDNLTLPFRPSRFIPEKKLKPLPLLRRFCCVLPQDFPNKKQTQLVTWASAGASPRLNKGEFTMLPFLATSLEQFANRKCYNAYGRGKASMCMVQRTSNWKVLATFRKK